MNTANRYQLVMVNSENAITTRVVDYWTDLLNAGLLKYRFNESENPTIDTVLEMIHDPKSYSFMVYDPIKDRLCADTMLNNFRGLTAHVHFSIHPDYHGREGVLIARSGAEQLFQLTDPNGLYLSTLIGLTPVNNLLAVRFIQKVGFKKLDIIDKVFYNNGIYTDALLTKLTPKDLYT